ncbi:MAG: hypothetical protein A2V88_09150 [Elusimicrobia bacterium RBG_16_66_12]|nr:MAG: hypothetical protein A2V88_09150 [Elusimicrobia bacterium RBG_16_66_12]
MALFEPIFDALNRAGVRYVVVGGLATVLHGYARLTVGIDLIVDLAPDEARKVSARCPRGRSESAPSPEAVVCRSPLLFRNAPGWPEPEEHRARWIDLRTPGPRGHRGGRS